ncbi:hypothetical protein KBD49_08535 [Myxococcota bacterium]|nr:hypothetical protein [Myxococcota bacterium]
MRRGVGGIGWCWLLAAAAGCGGSPEGSFDWQAFLEPPRDVRPWVRWWWPGNDVSPTELRREVGLLAQAGFGGAEIQAFDAALAPGVPEDRLLRRRSVGSPEFLEHLQVAAEAAREAGISLDLTAGAGWPLGGPFVSVERSMRTLIHREDAARGPATLSLVLDGPDKGPFYEVAELAAGLGEPLARYLPERASLVSVIGARVVDDQRDPDVFVLTDQVRLDPASIRLLTDRVGQDRRLVWEVPEGDWRIVSIWEMPDGEEVSLAAYPGESFVADHLDGQAMRDALEAFLGGQEASLRGPPWRGLFTDSFELECERHWARDFLAKFRELRGYDLEPWLPVVLVPGADNHLFDGAAIATAAPFAYGSDDDRVRWDYARTVSDLFLERGLGALSDWAAARGFTHRAQAYGVHVDPLEAAQVVHIPEAEQLYAGGMDVFVKAVSSGAHQYGRNLVGAEALVWSGRDLMTTPLKAKAALDKLFLAGVNAVTLHGFPYRTGEASYGPLDWHPFCSPFGGSGTYSGHVGEADPFWTAWPDLTRYAGRIQGAMRLGVPAADLLVLHPWLEVSASLVNLDPDGEPLVQGRFDGEPEQAGNQGLLETVQGLFGGLSLPPSARWIQAMRPVLRDLEEQGYSWEFVHGAGVLEAKADLVSGFVIGERRFKALVVPEVPALDPEVAEALAALAGQGVRVIFLGAVPDRQPGYFGREAGDARVAAAIASSRESRGAVFGDLDRAGAVIRSAGALPGVQHAEGRSILRHARRRLPGDERVVLLWNPSRMSLEARFTLDGGCRGPILADPMQGTWAPADPDDEGRIGIVLAPWETRLLLCGARTPADQGVPVPIAPASVAGGKDLPLEDWRLLVRGDDVPGGSVERVFQALGDWRDQQELRDAGSPGIYRTTFTLTDEEAAGTVRLDLGWLWGMADVTVNGVEAGRVLVPPFVADLTGRVRAGSNDLAVTVTPPLRNRMLALGDRGEAWARQFRGKGSTRVAAGLIGPVRLRLGAR